MFNPDSVPPQFEAKDAEEKWSRVWEQDRTYAFDEGALDGTSDPFVVDTPPPTVSGSLHVGHVFSYTQTDALARFHRMRGRTVFYPMGWDDNGLPTERRVQNYFHVRCEPGAPTLDASRLPTEPPSDEARKSPPLKISRANFIDLCVRLTAEDEKAFKALWERLGLSVDWSLEYSTISEHSRRLAQFSFFDLFKKGHVYSVEAPTMWDVDFRTAVAQAEVEDREVKGAFHKIRFGVLGGGPSAEFTIATTRPELLPACVAVATHPDDVRYKDLIGKKAVTPLFRAPVPIFGSTLVDMTKGTGILMVCTFGDATDVQWWREESLPLRQIVGRDGRLARVSFGTNEYPSLDPDAANRFYEGLAQKSLNEARKAIVEQLRDPSGAAHGDDRAPLVAEPEPISHAVKFFEKGDRPLEFVTSRQWFVRLLDKRARLIEMGDSMKWHPDFMRLRYKNWTENLQIDWCVSRQRYFGVPIPVWYPLRADGSTNFDEPIVAFGGGTDPQQLPIDPTVDTPPGYSESQRDKPLGFTADQDVFDTWFTSSLSPQIATRWMLSPERHKKLFPMSVRPQSHEIIRTWAFYTVAKALLHENVVPWHQVAISGWVLDPDRKKMSKSKGNVVTPMHLLDTYGSDAVRYWALSARLGVDTAFDEKVLKVGRRLVVKIFNAAKFVLSQQAGGPAPDFVARVPIDRGFLARLSEVTSQATQALETMDYAQALDVVERFFWSGFTDTYVELVKARAKSETDIEGRASAVATLHDGLSALLRLFAPYLPYVTEEVWSWEFAQSRAAGVSSSVHRQSWPVPLAHAGSAADTGGQAYDVAVATLQQIHRAKTTAGGSVGRHVTKLRLGATKAALAALGAVKDDVQAATRVLSMEIVEWAGDEDDSSPVRVMEIGLAPPPPKETPSAT